MSKKKRRILRRLRKEQLMAEQEALAVIDGLSNSESNGKKDRYVVYKRPADPELTFSPLAWIKLQYFLHIGDTEIGGFGVALDQEKLLYIDDFELIKQQSSLASVKFDDDAFAQYVDSNAVRGVEVAQCARIWIHTHPHMSATPSSTDEETFAKAFGRENWSVMFIVSKTGDVSARLKFTTGPCGQIDLVVAVDWEALPGLLKKYPNYIDHEAWQQEYQDKVDRQYITTKTTYRYNTSPFTGGPVTTPGYLLDSARIYAPPSDFDPEFYLEMERKQFEEERRLATGGAYAPPEYRDAYEDRLSDLEYIDNWDPKDEPQEEKPLDPAYYE